jgi:circadian clock protein KaiC
MKRKKSVKDIKKTSKKKPLKVKKVVKKKVKVSKSNDKVKKKKIVKKVGHVEKKTKKLKVKEGEGLSKDTSVLTFESISAKNILSDSKKKIKNNERVSSGIQIFDGMIGKGFQKNSTNLLLGGVGSGKTIFAMQFLIEGMKKNEKCLYLSFDEEKDSFYANMKELGWDLESYEKKGLFYFLKYSPQKIKTMLDEGGGIIENLVLGKKISRISMDSITSFLFLFKDEIEEREATLSLINLLKKWSCTTILTYEGDPSRENQTVLKTSSRILELESDSIILLYFLRNKGERGRYLEILKIKGVKHPTNLFPFSIEKNGVKVSKSAFKGELEL